MPAIPLKKRAVVVGIERFDNFRRLHLAEADAKAIAAMLAELGWQDVKLWLGSETDTAGLKYMANEVRDLLHEYFLGSATTPDSFVVFYYAGHGYLNLSRDKGFLAFPDTDESRPSSAIAMDDVLQNLVLATSAERAVAILDCCHSGAAFRGIRGAPRDETDLLVGASNVSRLVDLTDASRLMGALRRASHASHSRGRALLAACRPNELVSEEEAVVAGVPSGLSKFSFFLCEGWRGAAAVNNKVTIRRLSDWVADQLQGQPHTPMLYEPPQSSLVLYEVTPAGARPRGIADSVDSPYLADFGFSARSVSGVRILLPPFVDILNKEPFVMGSAQEEVAVYRNAAEYANEYSAQTDNNRHPITIEDFAIAMYPVTVAEYMLFLAAQEAAQRDRHAPSEHTPPDWQAQQNWPETPVTNVTWHDAIAYCGWLSSVSGQSYSLCSEAQWEKAARWDQAIQRSRIFVTGDDWDPRACNVCSAQLERIGEHPADISASGVRDLAGNVMEWTSSPLQDYPFKADTTLSADPSARRVVRGASYQSGCSVGEVRAARRRGRSADERDDEVGFRLVRQSEAGRRGEPVLTGE